MKYSVFSVSTPDLEPFEFIDTLKELGYNGVEWRIAEIPKEIKGESPTSWGNNLCTIDPATTNEELESLKAYTEKSGLEVVSLNPYLKVGDLEGTENVMRMAKTLGAKQIRLGQAWYDRSVNYNDLFAQAVKYLHGVEELSQTYGVKGLVETHHLTINPSAGLAHRLVDGFNPEHIGIMYDPGNLVYEGYENFRKGLELIAPYLSHVHVKNVNWLKMEQPEDGKAWASLPEGEVDWKQALIDLRSVGYDGYLGFEDFSKSKPTRELLQFNIDYIRNLVSEVYELV